MSHPSVAPAVQVPPYALDGGNVLPARLQKSRCRTVVHDLPVR